MVKKQVVIAFGMICLVCVFVLGATKSHLATAGGSDPTCTSSGPCIAYQNSGTGVAIEGIGKAAAGIFGETLFNSTSSSNARNGVTGEDLSTSGKFDRGVFGVSERGTGVAGSSASGAGVIGQSTSGVGMQGASSNSVGVLGTSNISDAVRGIVGSGRSASFHAGVAGLDSSTSGTSNEGVYGQTTLGIGVQAVSLGGGTGLAASSASGVGVEASAPNGISILAIAGTGTQTVPLPNSAGVVGLDPGTTAGVGVEGIALGHSAIGVEASTDSSSSTAILGYSGGGLIFEGLGTSLEDVFTVDNSGNVNAHSFSSGLASTLGKPMVAYVPHASEPIVEDFGEAQLTNGAAYVALESRFASLMARGMSYLVFITPEGDNRGLYVTQKTSTGFEVRESQGGRATIAFSYRIVAKPYRNTSPRLPNYMPRSEPRPVRIIR